MRLARTAAAYLAGAATTFVAGAAFYSQQVIARQESVGAVYTLAQQKAAYAANFAGLVAPYGVVLSIALLLGFAVAFGAKFILKPLAPVAYPLAGAAAVYTAIWLIETTAAAGGAGAIGGARDALGLTLQCLAGALGGLVFELLRPKRA